MLAWLRLARSAAFASAGLLGSLCVGGCSRDTEPDNFLRIPAADATADGPGDGGDAGPLPEGGNADPSLGGPCLDDGQCDDQIPCTFDKCDFTVGAAATTDGGAGRCRFVPDDAQCEDGQFCNGHERCKLGIGCQPGPVEACQDQDPCTIDSCVESTKSCKHVPRDLDGDGDPDEHCVAKHDCNDDDPNISSTHAEVCANFKDDDCDGVVDELDCASAQSDTCATATAITAPGTYALTTIAAQNDYAISCTPDGKDVVALVTIPPGGNKDLDLWATGINVQIGIAVQTTCGTGASEIACRFAPNATRVRARDLAPGTYAVILKTVTEGDLELAVDFVDPTPAPTNETCASPAPITVGQTFPVSLIDAAKDLPSKCVLSSGELTYSFNLAAPADVNVYATVLRGAGAPVLSLRSAACANESDELRCRDNAALPLFARNVPAGNYVLGVGSAQPVDLSVLVATSPPTVAPADDSCGTAPALVPNTTTPFDLANHDDDIVDDCFEANPDAAYDLTLNAASDVLLVGRFPPGDVGSVSLNTPTCTLGSRLTCVVSDSPARSSKRNVATGDYRVVVTDRLARKGTLEAFVRPTLVPVDVSASDVCGANITSIPAEGGYFIGDTSSAHDDVTSGCDQSGAPPSQDIILKLDLAQQRRVVLDMTGSGYTTLLTIRSGGTCPGLEIAGACHVGFNDSRSFLEQVLVAGTYWIIVDGFNGEHGPFNLDVRVVPP